MPKTYTEQLDEVQTAITAVMSGQSYTVSSPDGSSFTHTLADLGTLQVREEYLIAKVSQETRGGIRVREVIPI